MTRRGSQVRVLYRPPTYPSRRPAGSRRVVGIEGRVGPSVTQGGRGNARLLQLDARGRGTGSRIGLPRGGSGARKRREHEAAAVVVRVRVVGRERGESPVLLDEGEHGVE